ncbi:MAG: DNA recombination protein RmuC [Candidatus Magasanikbacteria bacterium]|nr:DNA recombination protein RmuC [Candidatus Magasanikbacteria bacterium]
MFNSFSLLIVFLVFVLLTMVITVYILWKKIQLSATSQPEQLKTFDLFQQQLHHISNQLNERLKENNQSITQTNQAVGERLDNAAKAYSQVMSKLNQLEEANKRIYDVGKDLASLQDILQAPKMRGTLGEFFLGDLLAQILPSQHFTLQYGFKNGQTVDAVVKLRDEWLVPVDAKFPLENFKKMMGESDEEKRELFRKQFLSDVKKHIEKISSSYILPNEKTLDFALMYIPAENVYYEIIIKGYEGRGDQNLIDLAYKKKVIPVSPNTFYVYLQAILIGLKGLQIEKGAKEILNHLLHLHKDLSKLNEDFTLVGTHLTRAKNSYDASEKRLHKFEDTFASLNKGNSDALLVEPDQPPAP